LLREILVINEYGADDPQDYRATVCSMHPRIEFIQKGEDARGQARTLNMILERVAGYDYWLHWEESWECTRPFIAQAIDVMVSTEITQLQLTHDWLDIGRERIVPRETAANTRYAEILPHPRAAWVLRGAKVADYDRIVGSFGFGLAWPLFSLRPGIQRAAFCRHVGPFDEKPVHWPVRFEWDYAVRWFARGGTKAVLTPHAAERQAGHVSTYR
jgi:hypothetical protein